jgi:DnaJ homolog subfamily C member 13
MTESYSFAYQSLSKELHVGNVYLRVYNNQPDYDISEPEAFCTALLRFISELVVSWKNLNAEVENDLDQSEVSIDTSEVETSTQNGHDLAKETEVITNLRMGLTSLQV